MENKFWFIFSIIGVSLILLIISLSFKMFNTWTFFGIIFYVLVYVSMYIYLKKAYMNRLIDEQNQLSQRRKFDYCWRRANQILLKMTGGQGIEWNKGNSRRSEFQTFYDGVQHREFRSMEGNLSKTQRQVVLIYDIDKDDIVRLDTSPSTDVLKNHFYKFNPFRSGSGGGVGMYGNPYRHNQPRKKDVSIHIGDGYDDYDEMKRQPPEEAVNKAIETLND